jgi:tRNA 2-selenouridine synthase
MVQRVLPAAAFVQEFRENKTAVLDARSEGEYEKAHIPGAINIPLLTNEERRIVGTVYKLGGREAAVLKGFELVGPRFRNIIETATGKIPGKNVYLYCWRGGMRSNIMSWVLGLSGFKVTLLKGGYKSFRNWVLETLEQPKEIIVLGGKTGSGKTAILKKLSEAGEQVIDLEKFARHKGSAFGGLGQPAQPSTEHFENLVACSWDAIDPGKRTWMENESRHVGTCILHEATYRFLRESMLIEIDVPASLRKECIRADYGRFPFKDLADSTKRIGKRLGPQHLKEALQRLEDGNFDGWLDIVLEYYDKLYAFGTTQRDPEKVITVPVNSNDVNNTAIRIRETADELVKRQL